MNNNAMDNNNVKENIDIIIPAYNAKETIRRALYSIAIQKINNQTKIKVYIVNDSSNYNYQDIIEEFQKFFSIEELCTEINMGPRVCKTIWNK